MNEDDFAAYYSQLTDGELAKIASARRTLVPDARTSLDREIAERQLSPEDLKRFKNDRHNYRQQQDPLVRKMRRSKLMSKVYELRKIPKLRWRGILVVLVCSFILAALFDHFGALNRMFPVCGSVLNLGLTLWYHREHRRRTWFWTTFAVWLLVHVWLVARVPWPSRWVPAKVWEGWLTIDLVAIFVFIALLEKLLHEGRYVRRHVRAHAAVPGSVNPTGNHE